MCSIMPILSSLVTHFPPFFFIAEDSICPCSAMSSMFGNSIFNQLLHGSVNTTGRQLLKRGKQTYLYFSSSRKIGIQWDLSRIIPSAVMRGKDNTVLHFTGPYCSLCNVCRVCKFARFWHFKCLRKQHKNS